MNKERITFYLRKDLIKELNECAKSVRMSRSQFVEWILENNLDKIPVVEKAMKYIFKKE